RLLERPLPGRIRLRRAKLSIRRPQNTHTQFPVILPSSFGRSIAGSLAQMPFSSTRDKMQSRSRARLKSLIDLLGLLSFLCRPVDIPQTPIEVRHLDRVIGSRSSPAVDPGMGGLLGVHRPAEVEKEVTRDHKGLLHCRLARIGLVAVCGTRPCGPELRSPDPSPVQRMPHSVSRTQLLRSRVQAEWLR